MQAEAGMNAIRLKSTDSTVKTKLAQSPQLKNGEQEPQSSSLVFGV
jgi:hypothetical protein